MKIKLVIGLLLLTLSTSTFAARKSSGRKNLEKFGPPLVIAGVGYLVYSMMQDEEAVSNFKFSSNQDNRFGFANFDHEFAVQSVSMRYQMNQDLNWTPFVEYSFSAQNDRFDGLYTIQLDAGNTSGFGFTNQYNSNLQFRVEYLSFLKNQQDANQHLISANFKFSF